jgi:hypothetical protein
MEGSRKEAICDESKCEVFHALRGKKVSGRVIFHEYL